MQQEYFYFWVVAKAFGPYLKIPNGCLYGYHFDASRFYRIVVRKIRLQFLFVLAWLAREKKN
jgi:hypothetical protein